MEFAQSQFHVSRKSIHDFRRYKVIISVCISKYRFIRKAEVDAFKEEMSNDLQGKFDEVIVQKMGGLNLYQSEEDNKR